MNERKELEVLGKKVEVVGHKPLLVSAAAFGLGVPWPLCLIETGGSDKIGISEQVRQFFEGMPWEGGGFVIEVQDRTGKKIKGICNVVQIPVIKLE